MIPKVLKSLKKAISLYISNSVVMFSVFKLNSTFGNGKARRSGKVRHEPHITDP